MMNLKVTPIEENNLELFKHRLEKNRTSLRFYPYTVGKKTILMYRMAFFGIGMVLALLGLYISMTSYNFIAIELLSLGTSAKTIIIAVTKSLAGYSLWTAAKMQPHNEMILTIVKKAKQKAQREYRKKVFFLKYQRTIENAEVDDADLSWSFLLEDVLESLEEKKQEALLLAKQIYTAKTPKKEHLFNELLVELEESTGAILEKFSVGG